MRIESLEYFLMAERCRSFTKAASNLFISPQGLQRAIAALEAETSLELFKREGRFIVPTEEGRIFSSFARDDLKRAEEFNAEIVQMQESDAESLSSLRISAMPFASTQLYDVMWHAIATRNLDTCIIEEIEIEDIFELLDQGLSDELILFALPSEYLKRLRGYSSSIEIVPLCRVELMIVACSKLISSGKTSISIKELSEFSLAYYNDNILNYFVARMPGIEQQVVMHSSNIDRILSLVKSGKAVTFGDTLTNYINRKTEYGEQGYERSDCKPMSLPLRPPSNVYLGFALSKNLPDDSIQHEAIRRFRELLETECDPYIQHFSWEA